MMIATSRKPSESKESLVTVPAFVTATAFANQTRLRFCSLIAILLFSSQKVNNCSLSAYVKSGLRGFHQKGDNRPRLPIRRCGVRVPDVMHVDVQAFRA